MSTSPSIAATIRDLFRHKKNQTCSFIPSEISILLDYLTDKYQVEDTEEIRSVLYQSFFHDLFHEGGMTLLGNFIHDIEQYYSIELESSDVVYIMNHTRVYREINMINPEIKIDSDGYTVWLSN